MRLPIGEGSNVAMELFPYQTAGAYAVMHHFEQGSKFVILDAPPGTGKTFIGRFIMEQMATYNKHSLYSCHSKALQRQFTEDFPEVPVMYGRSNYETEYEPKATAADCLGQECSFCTNCPYRIAKDKFLRAPVGMTNINYFLSESNYVGAIETDFIVLDEVDTLEKVLMDFAELSISERNLRLRYGMYGPKKKTVESSWVDWAEAAHAKMILARNKVVKESKVNPTPQAIKEAQYVSGIVKKLEMLNDEEFGIRSGNWVYDGYNDSMVKFRPIKIANLAERLIWSHVNKALLMSGTIISAQSIASDLGIDNYEEVTLPSRFPVENRPIYVKPVAKMTQKSTNKDYDDMAEQINAIMESNAGRILIHTVSYRFAGEIMNRLKSDRLITYSNNSEVESAISTYLDRPDAVLVAPSMSRGVSFSYDKCDVIIIVKIPYLSLGDKQVSARLYTLGGQLWYTVSAIRELVQMTGRGMRAADDRCATYILDSSFIDMLNRHGNKRLFPKWWRDAVIEI